MTINNKTLVYNAQSILKAFGYTIKSSHLHEMFARLSGFKNAHLARVSAADYENALIELPRANEHYDEQYWRTRIALENAEERASKARPKPECAIEGPFQPIPSRVDKLKIELLSKAKETLNQKREWQFRRVQEALGYADPERRDVPFIGSYKTPEQQNRAHRQLHLMLRRWIREEQEFTLDDLCGDRVDLKAALSDIHTELTQTQYKELVERYKSLRLKLTPINQTNDAGEPVYGECEKCGDDRQTPNEPYCDGCTEIIEKELLA